MIQSTISAIREYTGPVIGQTIARFETAQILYHDDNTWADWPDLPIRIHCCNDKLISIAWSKFDDLWLSNDESVPFPIEDDRIRWLSNRYSKIDAAVGKTIAGVMIGRGEMTIESRDIEIWTRLLFDLGNMWLEVFNALDENGYDLHVVLPDGEFRQCT